MEQLFPPVAHPVVRTHNVTGVKSLYVNRTFATHLENQDQELYNFLADKASVPEYQIRFKWKSIGDIAMWDNRVLQHYAVNDYQGKDRLMEHTASLVKSVLKLNVSLRNMYSYIIYHILNMNINRERNMIESLKHCMMSIIIKLYELVREEIKKGSPPLSKNQVFSVLVKFPFIIRIFYVRRIK